MFLIIFRNKSVSWSRDRAAHFSHGTGFSQYIIVSQYKYIHSDKSSLEIKNVAADSWDEKIKN
jgi:hypothetical protein